MATVEQPGVRGPRLSRSPNELLLYTWEWVRVNYLAVLIMLALLWVVAIPVLSVINFSFRDGTPAIPGDLTLQNYRDAWGNSRTGPALWNTVVYAVVVTIVSLSMATLFAWLLERTDMPFRNTAWILMLLPIAMPGMLSSMAWILMLSNRVGVLNVWARDLLGLIGVNITEGPFNIYSMEGMILTESLRGSSTLFLMMVAAFRVMDPALEEAASAAGVRNSRIFR